MARLLSSMGSLVTTIDNVEMGSSVGFPAKHIVQAQTVSCLAATYSYSTNTNLQLVETKANVITGVTRGNKVIAMLSNIQVATTGGGYGRMWMSLFENGTSDDLTSGLGRTTVMTRHYPRQGDVIGGAVIAELTTSASGSGTTAMDCKFYINTENGSGYYVYLEGSRGSATSQAHGGGGLATPVISTAGTLLTVMEIAV